MPDPQPAGRRGLRQRLAAPEALPPWSLLEVINNLAILFLGMTLLGGFITSGVAMALSGGIEEGSLPVLLMTGWMLGAVAAALYVTLTRLRLLPSREAMRIDSSGLPLPFLLLLGLGVAIALDVIGIVLIGIIPLTPELLYARAASPAWWILAVIFMVLIQPVAEELVFRGVVQPWLRARMGPWPGLVLTAALYAALHLIVYSPPLEVDVVPLLWKGLVVPLLAGLFLGGVRVYAGSTRAAIVAHVGMGVFAVLGALVLASG